MEAMKVCLNILVEGVVKEMRLWKPGVLLAG